MSYPARAEGLVNSTPSLSLFPSQFWVGATVYVRVPSKGKIGLQFQQRGKRATFIQLASGIWISELLLFPSLRFYKISICEDPVPYIDGWGTSSCVMVSKLHEQTFTNEFESQWVPHSFGLVPHQSKVLSKFKGTSSGIMVSKLDWQTFTSSSLIGCPVHSALRHIKVKCLVNLRALRVV